MRIKTQTKQEWLDTFETYQRWFAWYPIKVDGAIIWLAWVERIRILCWYEWFWKYKEIIKNEKARIQRKDDETKDSGTKSSS